jgi:hypothetical protein
LNPSNGNVAVEWDSIFLIDYSEIYNFSSITNNTKMDLQNTLYLLEAKQNINVADVLENLPRRLNTTLSVINSKNTPTTKKKTLLSKISNQRAFFIENPRIVVAIGSRNMNSTIQQTITSNGYIAIVPSGDDFKVVLPNIV